MKVYTYRHIKGQSNGIYTNMFDRKDMRTIGGWYIQIQTPLFTIEVVG